MDIQRLKTIDYFKNIDEKHDFDSLTKLLNRDVALDYFHYLIKNKTPFTVAIIDIDNFKFINDTYGHLVGDMVLARFGEALVDSISVNGIAGRYGGDEFIVILPNIVEYNDIWQIFHKLNLLVPRIKFDGFPDLVVTITAGATRFPLDADDANELIKTADKALYRGKSKGRNCFIIYLPEKHANIDVSNTINRSFNSMEMISKVFDIMTAMHDFKGRIEALFKFLSSYLLLESIALQTNDYLCYEHTSDFSKLDKFGYIPTKSFENYINSNGYVYINAKRNLLQISSDELFEQMTKARVHAAFTVKIKCGNRDYGALIAKSSSNRIWQPDEMDLMIVAARVIGMLLFKAEKTLDDIYKNED